MQKIKLSNGDCAKIDDVDYKYLNQWKWKRHKTCSKECAQKIRVRGMMKARGVW